MDPSRDNLLLRFTSFWWALGTFLIFGALVLLVWVLNLKDPVSLETAPAVVRYATKVKIDAAQAAYLSPADIEKGISLVSKKLAISKPTAIEIPAQIVPDSNTAKQLAAKPLVDTKAIDAAASNEPVDDKLMAIGKIQFLTCAACHGQNGEGGAIAPPLAGADWVQGPVSNLIRIQLRGLQGPIVVSGKEYNMPGGMAALAYQTDEQIAGVLTYIRNSFGNKASGVKPEQVAALRGEVGKPQLMASELTKP